MASEQDRIRGLDAAESEALFYTALPGPARPVEIAQMRVQPVAVPRRGPARTATIGVNVGGPYKPAFMMQDVKERVAAPGHRTPQFPEEDGARKPKGYDSAGQGLGRDGKDDGMLAVVGAPGCVIGGDVRWACRTWGTEGGGRAPAEQGYYGWSDGHDGTAGNRGTDAAALQAGRRGAGLG